MCASELDARRDRSEGPFGAIALFAAYHGLDISQTCDLTFVTAHPGMRVQAAGSGPAVA